MTITKHQSSGFLDKESFGKQSSAWCKELGVDQKTNIPFNRPALLVLDMQNEFLTSRGQMPVWGGPAIVPQVNNAIAAFRKAELPVFFTRHLCIEPYRHREELAVMENVTVPDEFLAEGGFGAELYESFIPIFNEQIITKYRYSAFYDTPLETLLRVNGVTDVVITGVATNICCETTAHDAFFRGFNVYFTVDGCGGTDENAHLASLRNIILVYGVPVTVESVVSSVMTAKTT